MSAKFGKSSNKSAGPGPSKEVTREIMEKSPKSKKSLFMRKKKNAK